LVKSTHYEALNYAGVLLSQVARSVSQCYSGWLLLRLLNDTRKIDGIREKFLRWPV